MKSNLESLQIDKPVLVYLGNRVRPSESVETFLAAQILGYDIILISKNLPQFAEPFIKKHIIANVLAPEELEPIVSELLKEFNIAGIPNWNEDCCLSVSYLCEKFGFHGASYESAKITRNKFLMRETLKDLKEYLPQYYFIFDQTDLIQAIHLIGFPAILKPTNGGGSKGVFKIENKNDAEKALDYLVNNINKDPSGLFYDKQAGYIYEQFIEGQEFSVEGFVYLNKVYAVGTTNKWTTDTHFIEYQHIFPANFSSDLNEKIYKFCEIIINKIGINNCSFHLEAKISQDGLKLIEVACRPGGDYITSHLIPHSLGVSFFQETIRIAVGQEPRIQPKFNLTAGVHFLQMPENGYFAGIQNLSSMLRNPCIKNTFLHADFQEYIEVPPFKFGPSRIGAYIVNHLNYELCLKEMNKNKESILVTT